MKVLSEKLSVEEITNRIGIECDHSWKIGDQRPKTIIKERNNGWIVQSGLEKEASLEEHVQDLLGRLDSVGDRIKEVSHHEEVEFSCVVYSEEIPTLFFEKATMAKISALGASLDIDLYRLPSE